MTCIQSATRLEKNLLDFCHTQKNLDLRAKCKKQKYYNKYIKITFNLKERNAFLKMQNQDSKKKKIKDYLKQKYKIQDTT